MLKKMTQDDAKALVKKRYPDYVVEWCVLYKNSYIVMAHPDDGPETEESGGYPDPFYAVSRVTRRVTRFFPVLEKDLGAAFFDAAKTQLGSRNLKE